MKIFAGVILGAFFALFVYAESDLPPRGDPAAPSRRHITPQYIDGAVLQTHTPNIVTAVLADYRGYDTLGETAVILTAGFAVMLILPGAVRRSKST